MGDTWGPYPEDYCRELGRFAFVFADVEGVAGELILVHRGLPDEDKGEWSRSGEQLINALRDCSGAVDFQELCADLETLTKDRNLFMHGEWSFVSDTDAIVLKRKHDRATKKPGYELSVGISPSTIADRTDHLVRIKGALGKYLLEKMGAYDESRRQ